MERKYDHKIIEEEILQFWNNHKKDIDREIADENKDKKDRFTFLEGPPTANAPPGIHHMETRVFKDATNRFKRMQGYKVSSKGGWDCHGLPVEVQVEKKLGLKSKKDVLKYGVKPFIEECKSDVFTFVEDWAKTTSRLGFWVDLDNPYMTLNKNYMESVFWALKEIHKKGLLYKGYKIVPYCGRCATPLSSHEVSQGYEDVEEETVVITFPAIEQEFFKTKKLNPNNKVVEFLAWTTTPWTLPSNLALAVHPKVEYAFVEDDETNKVYVLANDLVTKYFKDKKVLGTILGEELEGLKYEPLFNYFKETATNSFRIITANYVTTEDGTGIVHQAPAYGEDDNIECKKHGIDFVNPVDDNAAFTSEVKEFEGRFVKETDKEIIELLEKNGRLFKTMSYVHSYPFCWRCKTPLIYYAKDTWFIEVTKIRDRLVELNDTINWYPSTIKTGRFGNWLEGARDWALSRNKFWGTPLPIWVCENENCNHEECLGSIEEIKQKTGTEVDDLHIMTLDPLTYNCPKCDDKRQKGIMKRTPEVIDCWFDSGSAPFAQLHYPFENKELFKELFPYDFIAEAMDQTRGWFYTMHVISTILFDKAPYKNVAVAGLIADENGDKMSKSKGNIVKPNETFDEFGVDSSRLLMTSYSLGNGVKFGPSLFKEQITPFFTTLWNTYYYVQSYMERFDLTGLEVNGSSNLEDEWMISKSNSLVKKVTEKLEGYEYNHSMFAIMEFVYNVFSRTYIKLIRDRTNEKDEELAYVFRYAFDRVVKVLAPLAPYITEKLYQDFLKNDGDENNTSWSIHFSSWPKVEYINKDLETEFDEAQTIIQGILAAREKANVGVRWPLGTAKVLTEKIEKLNSRILELVKTQTNVKEIEFVKEFKVELKFEIDYKKLGDKFGLETGDAIPEVKKSMDMITKALNESDTVVVGKWTLTREEFKVEKIIPEPYKMAPFTHGEIYLDYTMTKELEEEGFSREITRRIQNLRKDLGLNKEDNIKLNIETSELKEVVEKYSEQIASKVGATELTLNKNNNYSNKVEEKVKGKMFTISCEKV